MRLVNEFMRGLKLSYGTPCLPGQQHVLKREDLVKLGPITSLVAAPSATTTEMANKRKRLNEDDEDESVEIFGRVVPTTWKDETITTEMMETPTQFDLHWCKFGGLKQHHWSRRENHYFKKNGESSSTCLFHQAIANSPTKVRKRNAKAQEHHRAVLEKAQLVEDDVEREQLLMTSSFYRANKKAQTFAAYSKSIGKCPGPRDKGCKNGNDAVKGRIYCLTCQAVVDSYNAKSNAKHNGTAAASASLRRHRARVKGRDMPSTPVYDVLASRPAHFANLLRPCEDILVTDKVIVWDTESDGRGSTNVLSKTREYYFYKAWTNEFLHIHRDDGKYTHQEASQNIMEFIKDADHLIAYEPSHCDRLRLRNLFLECGKDFDSISDKFVDFKHSVVDSIIDTSVKNTNQAYLPDFTLDTVYKYLFSVDGKSDDVPTGLHLVDAPSDWSKFGNKCKLDVHRLYNLLLIVRSLLICSRSINSL